MHADSIRRDQPEPPYRQLAAILRGRIERGELTGTVPSIRQLAQEYEVALKTPRAVHWRCSWMTGWWWRCRAGVRL